MNGISILNQLLSKQGLIPLAHFRAPGFLVLVEFLDAALLDLDIVALGLYISGKRYPVDGSFRCCDVDCWLHSRLL